ncbi:hypothetical protein MBLNU230_g1427t1 [Neophaeotheca triangularis]
MSHITTPHRPRTSSHSRTRNLPSRPTTPLRPPSRTSLRASQTTTPSGEPTNSKNNPNPSHPLNSLEPAFAELSDSMADLEANFLHLQLLNESLGRFNENFGSFLYGLNMSAFCVDFPEAPIPPSFARAKATQPPTHETHSQYPPASPFQPRPSHSALPQDVDATFMTNDTSFVENPPTSVRPASKFTDPPAASSGRGVGRKSGVPAAAGVSGRGRGVVLLKMA